MADSGENTVEKLWLRSTARRSLILEAGSPSPVAGDSSEPVDENEVHRGDFPDDFIFGCATSAYQVEGKKGKRGRSIWDAFCEVPGKIVDGSNGDRAADQYHRYKEDVNLITEVGFSAYRFSISWSRLIPDGVGAVNEKGVEYYNDLLDRLLKKGVQPFVSLYHWDLPQAVYDESPGGGWVNRKVVDRFAHYAEVCFQLFGSKVKKWITLNEPMLFCVLGYGTGEHAPGRCSGSKPGFGHGGGDSAVEPYVAVHHALLAHAAAVGIYRRKFQVEQGGHVGMAVNAEWCEAMTDAEGDVAAAQRRLEFQLAWVLDPVFRGEYPGVMRERVGERLPQFTAEDAEALRGSVDFVGLSYHNTRYIRVAPPPRVTTPVNYVTDTGAEALTERRGVPIGSAPYGLERLLAWCTERYGRALIYVTNGVGEGEEAGTAVGATSAPHASVAATPAERLRDTRRITYHQGHLAAVARALRRGADIRGYFVWSLLDEFEWEQGYSRRYGIFFVDFDDAALRREPKASALWLTAFLTSAGTAAGSDPLRAVQLLRRHSIASDSSANSSPASSPASPASSRPPSRGAARRKSSVVHPPGN